MTAVDLPAVPRVLIAEADPGSRDLLKHVLLNVRCDARLDICADGQQAATLLRDKAYDLILADWELPGIDGLSLLRSVRHKRRSPALPFILLSSRNDSASVREALPLAPTAYLTKPLNVESLTQRLQDLLLHESESLYCQVLPLAPGMSLPAFLERRRDACDGAPLRVDVKAAVQHSLGPEGLDLKDYLGNLEQGLIQQALDDANGIVARAAERLRIRRTTLVEKMRKYGMSRKEGDEQADD